MGGVRETLAYVDKSLDARIRAARLFNLILNMTGESNTKLAERLSPLLGLKTITRQTLSGWRKGRRPVPAAALLAAIDLVGEPAYRYLQSLIESSLNA